MPRAPAATTTPARFGARLAPAFLFAASGVAGLVLEVVWTRWLVLALGASARATTLVLAVFMGGLGLGALFAGRLGDRRPARTLAYFAAAEGLIGAWSLAAIVIVGRLLPGVAAAAARSVGAATVPVSLRALLAIVALAPPTLLMGATLPLLARWVVAAGLLPGRGVGALYTLNTLGGVGGALLAPFLLINRLGLAGAAGAAAAIDLSVSAAAFWLARSVPAQAARVRTSEPRAGDASRKKPPAVSTVGADQSERGVFAFAVAAYFVSGFVGLALEIVVHRVLAILAGSSVYAFSVMLAAFLAGIAGGAAAVARWADRARRPLALLGFALCWLAFGIGLARRLFTAGGWTALGRWAAGVPVLNGWAYGFELAACLLILLPATLALGASVPFVARVAALAPDRLAGRFGAAYAFNTAGAVLGAALGGLVLVPGLGTAGALGLLTFFAGAAGLAVMLAAGRSGRVLAALGGGLILFAAGATLGWGADPVRRALDAQIQGRTPLAFREGPVQTIAVVQESNDQQLEFLRLITNRTSLTGTHLYARRYMSLLGAAPALWTHDPRRAFVICFGTGMTAGAVASQPGVQRLDIAEISPEVVDVAPLFELANHHVLADPRVRLHIEDGRQVLLAASEPWDLITLEPPPPRDSGVVSLYTTDFYDLCRRRLSPGGVVAQWCPLHSQSLEEVRMIVRSFVAAFPNVIALLPVERDLILLGADRPLTVDLADLERRFQQPAVRNGLAPIGFLDPVDLLATVVADRDGLLRFVAGAPLVTDDRPRVELFSRFGKRPPLPQVAELANSPPALETLVSSPPSSAAQDRFRQAREALLDVLHGVWAYEDGRNDEGEKLLLRATQLRPFDLYYLWAAGLSDEHLARLRARAERRGGPRAWVTLAVRLTQRGSWDAAANALRSALASAPDDPEALYRLGVLLLGPLHAPEQGRAALRHFLAVAPDHPAADDARKRLSTLPER